MKRIAFYGGSFDPVHLGHLQIGRELIMAFALDEIVYVPAYHAPHKKRLRPTSAYDRYAMLCMATNDDLSLRVSKMEIEMPERPYSIETLGRINADFPDSETFFIIGADSWMDITTWKEWESVLTISNHIVVTRPGYQLSTSHVTDPIRSRVIDLTRMKVDGIAPCVSNALQQPGKQIFLTDLVNIDVSATEIRRKIRSSDPSWRQDVSLEVANYIEKYQIYS